VIGDDNPVNIGTRLAAEEQRLVEEGGVTAEDMARIHRTAVEVAFVDDETRARLATKYAGV
jgi:adenosine deaminase